MLAIAAHSSNALAQSTTSRTVTNPPVCLLSASVVAVNVTNADHQPVPGTTVEMVRLRDKVVLGMATEMRAGKGEFALMESDALSWIGAKGDSIQLNIKAGALTATAIVVVGHGEKGCGIVQLSGPSTIVVK